MIKLTSDYYSACVDILKLIEDQIDKDKKDNLSTTQYEKLRKLIIKDILWSNQM